MGVIPAKAGIQSSRLKVCGIFRQLRYFLTKEKLTMPRYTGGEIIAEYLIKEKVPYIFGICGHGNIGFLDALYHRSDKIKAIF